MIQRCRLLVVALLLACLAFSSAGAETLLLSPDTAYRDLTPYVAVLEDPERSLTFDDVTGSYAARFQAPAENRGTLNFGYSKSAYWLRFAVEAMPEAPRDWFLEISYPTLDHVDVYYEGKRWALSDQLPYAERPIDHRNYVVPLGIAPGGPRFVYIRVASEGSMTVPLHLWEPRHFAVESRASYVALAIYFGMMLALMGYNSLLFLSTRDRNFLFYVLFATSMAIGQLSANGLGNEFLWPTLPAWGNVAFPIGFALTGLFGALFTRGFLATPQTTPRVDRIIVALIAAFAAGIATIALVDYRVGSIAISLTGAIFSVVAVIAAVLCLRSGNRGARWFLIAWTLLLVGVAMLGVRNLGWLPTNFLTTYGMQIGSALEMLMLSFALADRINHLQHETERAQAEAIAAGEALVCALRDTERALEQRVAERTREVVEKETRFRGIFQYSNTGIAITEPSGRIVEGNRSFAELLGCNEADLPGRFIARFAACEPTTEETELHNELMRGDRASYRIEKCLKAGGERLLWADLSVTAIRCEDGRTGSLVYMAIDISERKKALEHLEVQQAFLEQRIAERTQDLSLAKEAAEAASRAKSTFLSNMSHELRTPMNAILGLTGIVLRDSSDPGVRDKLTKVRNASDHLLAVINDILDISKIEAGRLSLNRSVLLLGDIRNRLVDLVESKIDEKGLTLGIEINEELASLRLAGDPVRLCQILLNLVGNAVKFTDNGFIRIRIRHVQRDGDTLLIRFEVEDSGIGIAAEDQKRLFTAFEQADDSVHRRYGGTGLGLAISKHLVALMGGNIGVISEPGHGSTFWFTARFAIADDAPVQSAEVLHESTEEVLRSRFHGARILVAEDDPVNRELMSLFLDDTGMAADYAEDGVAAIELARRERYDIILMDVQMPKLNGTEATQAIRALPGYGSTPIIATTANAFNEDRERCLAAGMDDHLPKPIDADELYEMLLKWLSCSSVEAGER